MNELASYSIQAIVFAVIAMLAISRSKKADLYQLFLISAWLVGVIVIYARYGEEQVLFYSNDQLFHRQIIEFYLPIEGLTAEGIIGLRYLLTVPVYAISLTGLHPMLLNKFVQLIALLLIYQQSKSYLNFLAGWLPWVLYLDRTTFIFYAVVLSPFYALAISYALHHYWRGGVVRNQPWRAKRIVWFLILAIAIALYFLSIWMGYETPYWVWRVQMWFPWWI